MRRRLVNLPKVMRSKEPLGEGVPSDEWVEDGRLHILLSSDLTEEEADAERDRILAKHRRRRGLGLLPVAVPARLGRQAARHAREHTPSTVIAGTALAVAAGALAAVALPPALNGHHHAHPPLAAGPRPTAVAPPPQPPPSRQPQPGPGRQPPSAAPAHGTAHPPAAPVAPSRTVPSSSRTTTPPHTTPPSAAPSVTAPPPTIQPVSLSVCLLNLELLRSIRIRLCL